MTSHEPPVRIAVVRLWRHRLQAPSDPRRAPGGRAAGGRRRRPAALTMRARSTRPVRDSRSVERSSGARLADRAGLARGSLPRRSSAYARARSGAASTCCGESRRRQPRPAARYARADSGAAGRVMFVSSCCITRRCSLRRCGRAPARPSASRRDHPHAPRRPNHPLDRPAFRRTRAERRRACSTTCCRTSLRSRRSRRTARAGRSPRDAGRRWSRTTDSVGTRPSHARVRRGSDRVARGAHGLVETVRGGRSSAQEPDERWVAPPGRHRDCASRWRCRRLRGGPAGGRDERRTVPFARRALGEGPRDATAL